MCVARFYGRVEYFVDLHFDVVSRIEEGVLAVLLKLANAWTPHLSPGSKQKLLADVTDLIERHGWE